MGADLFAPWHIIILVVVLVILFGARRLPGAAQSLGQSMHIFRKSVQGLSHDDDTNSAANPPAATAPPAVAPAPPAVSAADATQQQVQDLQRQVQELQRQATATNGQGSEAQTSQHI
jgi:sec-independent protein translocase protein TatA